jgi:hypothetical protein
MVAWYPLDEQAGATTVQDIAPAPFSTINDFGNTQPGPVQSGGPMAVVGKVGAGALYFFGPHIQVPHSADLNFPSGLSIDAWIRVVDCGHGSGGVWAPIVDKWDPATQTGFSFFVDQPAPATGFLKLQLNNVLFTSTNSLPTSANPVANVGPWVHVAVTVDPTSNLGVFYINGAVAGVFVPPAGALANALPMLIGEMRPPGGRCELAIDELELFDRALSAQEITAIYLADSAGKCRPGPKPDAQICVEKFHDLNGDGNWGPNEPPLGGWQFVVTDSASNVVGMITSAVPGTPPGCLTLTAGTYVVTELLQAGWTNTTPLSQTVTLQAGQSTNLLFGNVGCLPPPPGMVAWWPLDDATNQTTVLDLAGANHGTPKNSAGVTIPVGIPTLWQLPDPGVFGGSLLPVVVDPSTSPPRGAFFFSDTYVEVPHHPSLNIGSNGLTITLWVWPTMGSGGPQPLVEKFDLASMNGYSLYLQPSGPNVFVLTLNLNGTVLTGPVISTSMTPSDWHFVVARLNASGQVILGACDMFSNCTNMVAGTVANFITTNTAPLWLSRSGVASPTGVDVRAIRVGLDEVEVFDRALSLAELQAIYAAEVVGMRKCPPLAEVCIIKFHDLDGDGVQDPGEPGLSGWQFVVNPAPLGLGTNVVTTGPVGSVCFGVSAPGTYTITELPQAGWTNMTPISQTVTVAPGQLTNVLFGNTTIQPGIATICIFKFHDLDGDGVQNPNEPGLSGWQFVVNPPPQGLGTNVATTGGLGGSICFTVNAPGTYTITELPQAGWQPTCPASQTVTVSPGQTVSLSFCNRRVCGDLNEVLNTGFNQSTTTLIPVGGLDDNWRITADPDPSTTEPRPADVVATTSWPAPQPGSQWISFKPSAVPIGPAPTLYSYQYCFCLAEGFSNAQLNLSIWADDIVDTVLLNGNVIGGGGGNFLGAPLNVATTNQALFRSGTNCVTIVVRDTHEGLTGLNVIGSVSATNGMCCCVAAPSGLVAWWPLDDATNQTTVLDLAGANHGTPKNSAGVTIPVGIPTLWQLPDPGVFGGSLLPVVVDPSTSPPRGAFFFSDTYVEVPHHPSLNIGSNGLTITLWVWPTMGSGGPQPLVEKFDLASMNGYSLYLQPSGPNVFVLTLNLNGTVLTGPVISTSMTPSDWHFVVARLNASGQVILGACDMFSNCTNMVAGTVANFITTNTAPLWLSRSGVASPTGVDVRAIRVGLDEVEVFDRALSLAELQAIYAAEVVGMRKCPPLAEVCIIKFHDLDGDGVQDPGEPGLSGWQFVVNPAPLGLGTNVVTTGPVGSVCFGVSAPGTYTITELPQAGWTNMTPISQTVTVAPGQWMYVVFGNKTIQPAPATLCIFKFHDLDGDGVHDPNEPLLPGWTVAVKYTNNVVALSLVTQTNPVCVQIYPGTFHVSEVLPLPPPGWPWPLPLWSPTVPASGTYSNVTFLPGQTVTLAFGNRKNIKIVGTGWTPPNPTRRLVIRMTAEPGQWYQLQYRESLNPDSPWRDWGEPVQATEPEVRFEVPVDAKQRQLYLRGIEKKDIWR